MTFTCGWNTLRILALLGFLFLLLSSSPCRATIGYELSLAHPDQHLFHVTMTIPDVANEVTVQIGAWNALYQIRDFSGHVRQVEASIGSEITPIEKLDKQKWRITGKGTIRVHYDAYWDEVGPFASQLNSEHAFINPAMILFYVPDRREEAVHLVMPDVPEQWQAAGSSIQRIESKGGVRNFSGDAPNYDALVDAPIEAGKFDEFQLTGLKPEVWVVVHGDSCKKKQLEGD